MQQMANSTVVRAFWMRMLEVVRSIIAQSEVAR